MRRRKEDEGQGDGKGEVFAEVIGGEPIEVPNCLS